MHLVSAMQWQRHGNPTRCRPMYLIPVPLHPEREQKRGYNQSVLLARELGRILNVPVVEDELVRTRNTASQTHLSREERLTNVAGAFACKTQHRFAGKRVTLIDDVATTGATLDASALALLAYGAEKVGAFTLCPGGITTPS